MALSLKVSKVKAQQPDWASRFWGFFGVAFAVYAIILIWAGAAVGAWTAFVVALLVLAFGFLCACVGMTAERCLRR